MTTFHSLILLVEYNYWSVFFRTYYINDISNFSLLSCKGLLRAQVLDLAQQQLNHAISRSSRVAGQLVTGQLDLVVGNTTLISPVSY